MPTIAIRIIGITSCAVAGIAASDTGYLQSYTPDSDGKFSVECACVSPTAGLEQCVLGFMDAAAGYPRTTWRQDLFGKAGKEIDVASACFRKRDVASGGSSSCCEAGDESSSKKFFAAKIIR